MKERIFLERFGLKPNNPIIQNRFQVVIGMDFGEMEIRMKMWRRREAVSTDINGVVTPLYFTEQMYDTLYNVLNIDDGKVRLLNVSDIEAGTPLEGTIYSHFMRPPGEAAEEFYQFEDGTFSTEYRYKDLMALSAMYALQEMRSKDDGKRPSSPYILLVVGCPADAKWKDREKEFSSFLWNGIRRNGENGNIIVVAASGQEALQAAYEEECLQEALRNPDYLFLHEMLCCSLMEDGADGYDKQDAFLKRKEKALGIHTEALKAMVAYSKTENKQEFEYELPFQIQTGFLKLNGFFKSTGSTTWIRYSDMQCIIKRALLAKEMLQISIQKLKKKYKELRDVPEETFFRVEGIWEMVWENLREFLVNGNKSYLVDEILNFLVPGAIGEYGIWLKNFLKESDRYYIYWDHQDLEKAMKQLPWPLNGNKEERYYVTSLDFLYSTMEDCLIGILRWQLTHEYGHRYTLPENGLLKVYVRLARERRWDPDCQRRVVNIPITVDGNVISYPFQLSENVMEKLKGYMHDIPLRLPEEKRSAEGTYYIENRFQWETYYNSWWEIQSLRLNQWLSQKEKTASPVIILDEHHGTLPGSCLHEWASENHVPSLAAGFAEISSVDGLVQIGAEEIRKQTRYYKVREKFEEQKGSRWGWSETGFVSACTRHIINAEYDRLKELLKKWADAPDVSSLKEWWRSGILKNSSEYLRLGLQGIYQQGQHPVSRDIAEKSLYCLEPVLKDLRDCRVDCDFDAINIQEIAKDYTMTFSLYIPEYTSGVEYSRKRRRDSWKESWFTTHLGKRDIYNLFCTYESKVKEHMFKPDELFQKICFQISDRMVDYVAEKLLERIDK